MAIIKCKMCGGDLDILEGKSVAECEYCGSQQTVPNADNEKKLSLFARANRLRASCEFDKAAGIYESIVADFPQEAEAYWGLVLCKYGIEYVDDPAGGKKVPTCHRSSFESVMEDSDLEQALENADSVARRVYREEAKAIEEIRKGILEVSANEEPYDIFICYKETAENGDRTIDSVIAQDVYDALTEKGYRVFFSRITLEDKLGTQYEPYIFAALHSAKIMLAFGTDYEYYNAVWVKNEWSRFLQLIAAGQKKTLIPCYKGIDAYDMPKEFARLQAQDMGKVGAVQDLLRGVEKIIPKSNAEPVVQERVVTVDGASNKINALMQRGTMALEDEDWRKADEFFEEVLNNDATNAQAYLGKALAQERCRTLEVFISKRKDASENVRGEKLALEPDHDHASQVANQYELPGWLSQDEILKLYHCDLSYHSDVKERTLQYSKEEEYWANHKWFTKAEKFASGDLAELLANEKKALFAILADRIKQAEAEEASAIKAAQERYAAFMEEADAKAEDLSYNANARWEVEFQRLQKIAENSCSIGELNKAATEFERLGNFEKAKKMAGYCRKRAAEEHVKLTMKAEEERRRVATERAKTKKNVIILTAVACVIFAIVIIVITVIIPNNKYNKAMALMNEGKYVEAVTTFKVLDGYKDSVGKIKECEYTIAESLMEAGQYEEAIKAFEALKGYRDSAQNIVVCNYHYAEALLDKGDNAGAAIAFGKAGDYQDANARSMALWDEIAQRDTIGATLSCAFGLKKDGTVVVKGTEFTGAHRVSDWRDIVAISVSNDHIVGLRKDGTVVAAGSNENFKSDVSTWKDIVAISAGRNFTLGLKKDGTVVGVGKNRDGSLNVSAWTDIVAVSAGSSNSIGLKKDGTVVVKGSLSGRELVGWTDIVAVDADYHIVGLKKDGTVVAMGDNKSGECDVQAWKDILAISAGPNYTVGLKKNGTVVARGENYEQRLNVSSWKNIVAISTSFDKIIGLKNVGTLVASGTVYSQKKVDGLTGIKLPQ